MRSFGEQGTPENPVILGGRRGKVGLETPLRGRFYGERRLAFAPPLWYDALVLLCIFGGGVSFLWQMMKGPFEVGPMTSIMVFLAGLWGAASNERMIIDLRTRRYMRIEGAGLKKKLTRGSLDDLDALVLTSEHPLFSSAIGMHVIYRLVLYWKGQREPLLVVEREDRTLAPGSPINAGAGNILQRGARYSRAMNVKYFDNSYMLGQSPVPYV